MPVKRLNKKTTARASKTSGKTRPMASKLTSVVKSLEKAYKSSANQDKAVGMKKYMRDQFEYYGINSPERKKIDKEVRNNLPDLSIGEYHQLLSQLWKLPQREYQYFAAELATKSIAVLKGNSDDELRESIEVIKNMITNKSWWDCVDILAPRVIGEFNKSNPKVMGPILDKWIADENIWLKRTAILHQLYYKQKTDQDKLFKYSLACAAEKDFFIRKAIGWALRNQFRVNPAAVKEFVKQNEDNLSNLSKKEALKHA